MLKVILLIANFVFLFASVYTAIEDQTSSTERKKGYALIIVLFALNEAYIIGS